MQKEEDQAALMLPGPLDLEFMILSRHDSVYSDPTLRREHSVRKPSPEHRYLAK
jgi:hypothetical protein